MSITDKQLNYINILSSYDYSRKDDQKIINNFLSSKSKNNLKQLNSLEASSLIQKLLEIPTGHLLPCDTVIVLDKREVNSFHVISEIEACLHYCPYGKDVGDCDAYHKYEKSLEAYEENDILQNNPIDFSNKKIIYIQEQEEKPQSNREYFEKILDDFVDSNLSTISIDGEEYDAEVSKYYLLFWIRQKHDIDAFNVYIKNNNCYLSRQ